MELRRVGENEMEKKTALSLNKISVVGLPMCWPPPQVIPSLLVCKRKIGGRKITAAIFGQIFGFLGK